MAGSCINHSTCGTGALHDFILHQAEFWYGLFGYDQINSQYLIAEDMASYYASQVYSDLALQPLPGDFLSGEDHLVSSRVG